MAKITSQRYGHRYSRNKFMLLFYLKLRHKKTVSKVLHYLKQFPNAFRFIFSIESGKQFGPSSTETFNVNGFFIQLTIGFLFQSYRLSVAIFPTFRLLFLLHTANRRLSNLQIAALISLSFHSSFLLFLLNLAWLYFFGLV